MNGTFQARVYSKILHMHDDVFIMLVFTYWFLEFKVLFKHSLSYFRLEWFHFMQSNIFYLKVLYVNET